MNIKMLTLSEGDLHKILAAGSADAALLYLYIHSGNLPENAQRELGMSVSRLECAGATLRQLGLWPEPAKVVIAPMERPAYSEHDVLDAVNTDADFKTVYGEVQRLLGRGLNTEEMKILLSLTRYLGFSGEVIAVLVSFCRDRARQQGRRAPSLRTIEKEAYHWAEEGIDTLEAAAAYIHRCNVRNSRLGKLMSILQIRGRSLTAAEEKYATKWLEMGFTDEILSLAYERTCLNTGSLSWPYMDKVLQRWKAEGYTTAEQVRSAGRRSGATEGTRVLDADEQAAIARMLQEG